MNRSLRLRLVVIILVPLLAISALVSTLAVYDAQRRASERFDRSLLSAVLAISRDVALSGGDALSPETNAILQDTSGGRVYYHVYAPDGVFVTGYATPPVPPWPQTEIQSYYDSSYQGEEVRVLRFTDAMQIEGLSGEFTFSVWQKATLRTAIVRDLSWRTSQVIATLVLAVALVVWFGVRIGLRPLLELENAIALRSADDLTAIKRQVPIEARDIVSTLNRLFGQVSSTMAAKDEFISNAAHQLRNPIAGVVAMSEAVSSAKNLDDMRERSGELVIASRRAGDLANKLLALERASAQGASSNFSKQDLSALVAEACDRQAAACAALGVALRTELPSQPLWAEVDATMLSETLTNLIENALHHGGLQLKAIDVRLHLSKNDIRLEVRDDGIGIAVDKVDQARGRFGQLHPSDGSGLGLAIADAVAQHHGGRLAIRGGGGGLCVAMLLPRV